MNDLYVFGITGAMGGIEVLMHPLLTKLSNENIFAHIHIVTSNDSIAFQDEYKALSIDIIKIPNHKKFYEYKKALYSIASRIKKDDIVYLNISSYCNWILFSQLYRKTSKIIVHGHNSHTNNFFKKILHFIGKMKFLKTGYKIAVSEECSKFMFNNKHSTIIPNGIENKKFSFDFEKRISTRIDLGISNEDFVIACVGRISSEKNQIYAVKMANRYKNLKFIFVGDFMNLKYKKKITKKSKENCFFVGRQNDVGKYLSTADALIMPSKHEAFPLVIAEALNNGLPIFCCNYLENKLPYDIVKENECFFIKNNVFDMNLIAFSNEKRNKNEIINKSYFEIETFLERVVNVICEEI